jgi:hypothetical protein
LVNYPNRSRHPDHRTGTEPLRPTDVQRTAHSLWLPPGRQTISKANCSMDEKSRTEKLDWIRGPLLPAAHRWLPVIGPSG